MAVTTTFCVDALLKKHAKLEAAYIAQEREIERLRAEVDEQARLNGAGAERELALRAEIENLRAQISWLLQDADQKEADAIVYNLRIERLNAKNARLREVLTFYAEAWTCRTTKSRLGGVAGLEWRPKNDLLEDCGNAARDALAEKREK